MKMATTLMALPVVGALGAAASPALAWESGDWLVRVGGSHVSPNEDTDDQSAGLAGAGVDISDDTQLSFTVSYFLTERYAVELLGALPFEHDIDGDGSLAGAGTIATTKHLPPTLSLQYHFPATPQIKPYVGLGVNYTNFFDEETKGPIAGTSIDLDDSWGLAGQVGVDVSLNDQWSVNGDVRYMDIDTTAELGNGESMDVQIDPWVLTLAVGRRFSF